MYKIVLLECLRLTLKVKLFQDLIKRMSRNGMVTFDSLSLYVCNIYIYM